jgi:hypothetical protein
MNNSGQTKSCLICNLTLPIEEFYLKKSEKDGRHRYCKKCNKEKNDLYYKNIGKLNREEYYIKYREENREYFRKSNHFNYHHNKDYYRKYNVERYNNDVSHKIKKVTAVRIHDALKAYNSLKNNKTISYLGCSIGEYVKYLESLFTPEMNWNNYGKGKYWEIDHYLPIDSFDLTNEEECYKCFHYKNTRPLSIKDNREKSNKII